MKLKLAIVQECGPEGCKVQDLNGAEPYQAAYSALVRDRIRIRQRQMVAVDSSANPPEIVWRWHRPQVLETKPEGIVVALGGEYCNAVTLAELPLEVQAGDQVWACGVPDGYEIHDRVVDEQPAHPERLLAYITPVIEAVYKPA